MAERRMFAKTIIDSDAFLEMPQSSQLLYFHLSMRGDDDGFINKPKTIMRMVGCKDDDLRLLIGKKFIIPFETGVVVVKHWKIHNYIQNDRYNETKYKDEKSLLTLDENKAYKLIDKDPEIEHKNDVYIVDTQYEDTQVRLGKDSIDKINKKSGAEYEKKYSDGSFELKCVQYLTTSIRAEMPDAKLPETDKELDKWCDHIEKMLRLDKRTEKDIYDTLLYARTDTFWKANIRSTSKFREKYETLFMQMKNKGTNPQPAPKQTTNKFNNHEQRNYSAQDYADLERKLINKGL